MHTFFSSLHVIERITRSLNISVARPCPHCHQTNQWVSHGYIVKTHQKDRAAGKRILCANRYQKVGCGRTQALYVASVLPRHRYTTEQILAFVRALIAGCSISHAYYAAVSYTKDARQAWRWVNAMIKQLSLFRLVIPRHGRTGNSAFQSRSRRLQLLLSTLQPFIEQPRACEQFQLVYQIPWLSSVSSFPSSSASIVRCRAKWAFLPSHQQAIL